uniref:Cytochrome c oxidase assembly factor 3 n=1 Tax=Strongyloides stercoralis TaxID=6248 RepID=A0A0K0E7G5_STRER
MSATLQKLMKLSLKQRIFLSRSYSLSIKEPSKTLCLDKSRQEELDKLYDEKSEFLQRVEIGDLPRVQQRYAKQFERLNEERVKEIFEKNYKNIFGFIILLCTVVGIYSYTIFAVKQETLLEEIDEEVAAEKGINQTPSETKRTH